MQIPPDHGGYTTFRSGGEAISEVYRIALPDLRVLARVIYHEAMHNILRMDGPTLHALGGLASARIDLHTQRNSTTDGLMASHLATTGHQWTGGFEMMAELQSDLDSLSDL